MSFTYRSETISEISKALIEAQKYLNANPISKNKKGLRNTYASYEEIASHCQEAALSCDICMTQSFVIKDDSVYMCLMLIHKSGEFLCSYDYLYPVMLSPLGLKTQNDEQQAKGSIKTYVGRYQLKHMFCLAIEEDDIDDGKQRYMQQRPAAPQKVYINKEQREKIKALLENLKNPRDAISSIINLYSINKLEEIEARNFETICHLLLRFAKEEDDGK
jgi:hypothetical protein